MDHPYKWPKIDGGNLGLVISPRKKWSYFTLQKNCCLGPPCSVKVVLADDESDAAPPEMFKNG